MVFQSSFLFLKLFWDVCLDLASYELWDVYLIVVKFAALSVDLEGVVYCTVFMVWFGYFDCCFFAVFLRELGLFDINQYIYFQSGQCDLRNWRQTIAITIYFYWIGQCLFGVWFLGGCSGNYGNGVVFCIFGNNRGNIIVQQKHIMAPQQPKTSLKSRKQSLQIHNHCNNHPQHQNYLSPRSYLTVKDQMSPIKPHILDKQKTVEEAMQKNYTNCQNHFLRKTVLVLYKYFQKVQKQWQLNQLSYNQMIAILQQLSYVKTCLSSYKHTQQLPSYRHTQELSSYRHTQELSSYRHTQELSSFKHSQELKKCYYLWINISQNQIVKLTNLIIILCHIEHMDIDYVLVDDIVKELQKGISKFQLQQRQDAFPSFIFLVRNENWQFRDQVLQLSGKQVKTVQNQFSSFKYTRLTYDDHKIDIQDDKQQNPVFPMSKKSVELASNKRQKILREIKNSQNVQTIELYHILSYKKEVAKPAVSKIQQGLAEPSKRKVPINRKRTVSQRSAKMGRKTSGKGKGIGNKQNKRNNNQKTSQQVQNSKMSDEIKQISDLLSQDLGVSQITKTQILDEFQISSQEEEKTASCAETLLPQSLLADQSQKQKKRREYIELPILYVDVNLEQGKKERIVVYQGDTAEQLSLTFGQKHNLCAQTVSKLEGMLALQIGSVLHKIDEALEEDCSYLY